jgi:anti-sigma factor RsiW
MLTNKHRGAELPALLDGELTDGEAVQVVEHLRLCDGCRRGLVEAVANGCPPGIGVSPSWSVRREHKSAKRARRVPRKPPRNPVRPVSSERRLTRFIDAAFAVIPLLVAGVYLLVRALTSLL